MAGLGPRVGGAHVDVNLKFDEKSLAQAGKQIHRQLSKLSDSLVQVGERNSRVYQELGKSSVTAWRTLLGAVVSGAPLMGSAISAVSGAATMLAGSLYSSAQASAAMLPIFTSLGVAGVTLSIGMRNFGAAVSEVDPKALLLLLDGMPKSMQAAVMSTRKLSNEMRAAIWPKLFAGLNEGIDDLRETGVIQRGLGQMAVSLNSLAKSVLNYANSRAGVSTLTKFFQNNAEVFRALSQAAVPFLDGFLRLTNALSPAAIRLAGNITGVAESFQEWTKGEGFGKRVDDSMRGAAKTAGLLWSVLTNLGSAIANVFNAANPSTNTFLQMLVDVTQRFEDWTDSIGGQNSIAKWAAQSVDVMGQFGRTVESAFRVIAELADPRVIISFLKTVEGAFDILGNLPLDSLVNAFVSISEVLQPVSSAFLAIIIAGASLNILLGALIGQLGGVFSIFSKILQFKILTSILNGVGGGAGKAGAQAAGAAKKTSLLSRAWAFLVRILDGVKSAFNSVVGLFTKTGSATGQAASSVSKLGAVFKPVMSMLARFSKFAGPVGIAVWIGTIIAKSETLQEKLGGVWDSMKTVWTSLVGAFKEIGAALKPLSPVAAGAGKAFGVVFDVMDKLMGLAIGVFLDLVISGFTAIGNVISGLGSIVAGFINILVGLFTLDFSKMFDGLKQMASGIVPLLQGVFGLFVTFFAPARLAKIGVAAIKALGGGVKTAMPGILSAVGQFIVRILKFFVTLPARLLGLGMRAFGAVAKAVTANAPKVLAAVGRMVNAIFKWVGKLPGRLLRIGSNAVSALGSAIARGTGRVLSVVGKISSGIIKALAKMPGRLADIGKNAVSLLSRAVGKGVSALSKIAGNIVDAVLNPVKALPKKLSALGSSFASSGKTLGSKVIEGIKSGISAIGTMASSIAGTLKSGINRAIGLPKSLSFNVLGKKIGFTIPGFERGTNFAPGGLAWVGEGGPELVNLPRGSKVHTNAESKKMSQMPKTMILRIGSRDFVAYLEEVADERINAADNLAWQGA